MSKDAKLRRKALDVLSLMRGSGFSLTKAASFVGITVPAVQNQVGSALEKEGARWTAKPWG
jgi:hypothetical protein